MKMRPALPLALLLVIYLGNVALSRWFDVYGRLPWFDIPMHLLGGFVVGMLAISIQQRALAGKQGRGLPFWYQSLFVIGIVMTVAVIWEWHEFVLDWIHQDQNGWARLQPTNADTMKDLFDGFVGGWVSIGIFLQRE
jgi:hypothetical protein